MWGYPTVGRRMLEWGKKKMGPRDYLAGPCATPKGGQSDEARRQILPRKQLEGTRQQHIIAGNDAAMLRLCEEMSEEETLRMERGE